MSVNVNQKHEEQLKKISELLQAQALNQTQLNQALTSLQELLHLQKMQVDASTNEFRKEVQLVADELFALRQKVKPKIKRIEDIPCIKHPKWYEVVIDYEPTFKDQANVIEFPRAVVTGLEYSGYTNINPEGPFVISQVAPYFEITQTDLEFTTPVAVPNFANPQVAAGPTYASTPKGRILPCTIFPFVVNSLGKTTTTGLGYASPNLLGLTARNSLNQGVLMDIPEFSFQIEIGGSGKFWTNQPIPAAAFFGMKGSPAYLGSYGWVAGGDRIIVKATLKSGLYYKGRIRFFFHGYQMLGKININEALGL